MKIAWLSNAPFVGSGYGVQSAIFGPRVAELGHDVAFLANWGVQGSCLDWEGHRIYPADGEWGNRTFIACAAHHADGLENALVVALCDPWVLKTDGWPKDLRMAIWAPVDHDPLPVPARHVLRQPQVTPIAMSRFGEQAMLDAGLKPLYVPHGVETDVYRPDPDGREATRREVGLPEDAFVVGIVGANMGGPLMHRKGFPQMFQAFARFRESHRDARLYVHSCEHVFSGNGMPLRLLANKCGIPRRAVTFTDAFSYELGLQREDLAGLYQSFDVLLSASMGEGFGIPIVEAQASGVPVIVTDHTAMTELCGAGWLVDGDLWYDGSMDSWFKSPSVDSIVAALEQAYEARDDQVLRARAREFALGYDADRVTEEFWAPALAALRVAAEPVLAAA